MDANEPVFIFIVNE